MKIQKNKIRKSYYVALGFFIVLFIPRLPVLYGQNIELLNTAQIREYQKLKGMKWIKELTETEKEKVKASLTSDADAIVEEALKILAVHHLSSFIPTLEMGVGKPHSFARILAKIIVDALRQDVKNFEEHLLRASATYLSDKSEDYLPLNDRILSILVIQQARYLREDSRESSFSLSETELIEFHKLLLKYSSMPEKKAIESIIQKLTAVSIAGSAEYDLVEVLNTYGQQPVSIVVNLLNDTNSLESTTSYGRLLLLHHLRSNFVYITEEELKELSNLFSQQATKAKYFDSPVALRVSATLFEEELNKI